MASTPTSLSNLYLPMIDSFQFKRAVRHIGRTDIILRGFTEVQCDCFDDLSGTADPECATCDGTGLTYTERFVEGIIRERPPHGMYGSGDIISVAGEVNRHDAMLFCIPRFDGIINMGDIVLWNNDEYRIVNKYRRLGTRNKFIYVAFELWKTTRPITAP